MTYRSIRPMTNYLIQFAKVEWVNGMSKRKQNDIFCCTVHVETVALLERV